MKATKYLSLAALALMGTLASCQSDDEAAVSFARPDNAVGVNFSVGSLQGTTRSNAAATDDTQRQFNQGDQISVSTNDQEAVLFQCTSTDDQTWTEAVAGKFLLWTQPMLTFSAYYPVTDGTSMTAFTLPADQSTEANIALADYMTRQQNISRPEGGSDIQMQLERKMARVIVRISGFGNQYFDYQKTVSNVRINSQFSAIADGNGTGDIIAVNPYQQGNGGQGSTYTALVVPGDGDSGARFIQLTDGASNTLEVKGIPELNAGNSYTFNLVVGKNRIEVASVTVQDWTTGETLAGGQATELPGPTYPNALSAVTADYVGSVVTTDGNVYATVSDATTAGKTAVAMIAYVSGSNGLAIALADEGNMNWATAKSTCEGKAAIGGNSWKLPSQEEWKNMLKANGGNEGSCTGLNNAFATAGFDSSKLLDDGDNYWWTSTPTEFEDGCAYFLGPFAGVAYWNWAGVEANDIHVRAVLAFTVGGGPTYTLLSAATTADYGKVVCADGHLHDAKTAVPEGCTAVGILGKVTETGHGLILALKNATSQTWNTINGWTSETTYAGTTLKVLPDDAARGTNLTSDTTLGETTVSNWAVAQKSDYEEIFTNLGSTKNNRGMTYDKNVNAYITTGVGGTAMAGDYWSATQDDDYDAWYFQESYWYDDYNTSTYYVRPVLGF